MLCAIPCLIVYILLVCARPSRRSVEPFNKCMHALVETALGTSKEASYTFVFCVC